MFETLRIKIFGTQPAAKVTDKALEQLIQRDFGIKAVEVKQKLTLVNSDTHGGKNRISAAIIKLSNRDINAIDYYIEISKNDFRDVISQAEYPRCSKFDFSEIKKQNTKQIYLEDWNEYWNWMTK
jgi:hypothetical protein